MTNLEYLKTLNAEDAAKVLSKVVDGVCEVRFSCEEDEQGLEIVWLDKEKFVEWLNKDRT